MIILGSGVPFLKISSARESRVEDIHSKYRWQAGRKNSLPPKLKEIMLTAIVVLLSLSLFVQLTLIGASSNTKEAIEKMHQTLLDMTQNNFKGM